jgi:hypothetical protein
MIPFKIRSSVRQQNRLFLQPQHLHVPAGVPPVPVSRSTFRAGTPQAMLVLVRRLQI